VQTAYSKKAAGLGGFSLERRFSAVLQFAEVAKWCAVARFQHLA
jgi:hypothetical protein